jgi:hypothetical protein
MLRRLLSNDLADKNIIGFMQMSLDHENLNMQRLSSWFESQIHRVTTWFADPFEESLSQFTQLMRTMAMLVNRSMKAVVQFCELNLLLWRRKSMILGILHLQCPFVINDNYKGILCLGIPFAPVLRY